MKYIAAFLFDSKEDYLKAYDAVADANCAVSGLCERVENVTDEDEMLTSGKCLMMAFVRGERHRIKEKANA